MKIIFESATIIKNGQKIVSDVFVDGGKIVLEFARSEAERVVDAQGKLLMPGAIDCHVHFREPGATYKEDFESGSRAAVMGGVTTVLDMPNNNPPITTQETLDEKRKVISGKSYVNYGLYVAGAMDNLEDLKKIKEAVGIKIYMGSSTGNILVDNLDTLEKIFEIAKEKNIPVVVHAENEKRIQELTIKFQDRHDSKVHAEVRDCECAKIALKDAINLQKRVGNKLHIAHMTCAEELNYLRQNKNEKISAEVCPHHLYFSVNDMKDAYLKMNPPLRSEDDLRALWEGLRDGIIDIISTDHAPHSLEEKMQDIWVAPAGVPGVEFLLPLMLNEVNENMLTLERLQELLCTNPARIFSLNGKGSLEIGADADLVLIDMDLEKTISREMIQSKCGWSPYEGYHLKGWPIMTVVSGEIIVENTKLVGPATGKEFAKTEFAKN